MAQKRQSPRFGLAYRVTDKTLVRAGYGIYFNPNQTNSFTFLSFFETVLAVNRAGARLDV